MAKAKRVLNIFRNDERGNIALVFALSLVPVAGVAGIAVDISKSRLRRTQPRLRS
jgi:Flp pilus assembly protein TadG